MVELREITEDNFEQCVKIRTSCDKLEQADLASKFIEFILGDAPA